MFAEDVSKIISSVRIALSTASGIDQVLRILSSLVAEYLPCERVFVAISTDGELRASSWGEAFSKDHDTLFTIEKSQIVLGDTPIEEALFINDIQRSRFHPSIREQLEQIDTKSFGLIGLKRGNRAVGWIEVHFRKHFHKWRKEDVFLLELFAEYAVLYIEKGGALGPGDADSKSSDVSDEVYRERLLEARQQFRRVLQYGNLIIVRTNAHGVVTDVIGDTQKIFGVSPGDLLSDLGVWSRFVPSRDLRGLLRSLREVQENRTEVQQEIRVINQRTGNIHWLLIRGVPLFNGHDEFVGWEGFAVEITERHHIQEELEIQRKRLEALYDISKSLHATMDPSVVLLKGLRALMKASGADAGVNLLYTGNHFEIVATEGFSTLDLEILQRGIASDVDLKIIFDAGDTRVVKNIGVELSESCLSQLPYLKSALIVPLRAEDKVRGLMVLVSQAGSRFDDKDVDLSTVASSQVASVLGQAEYYADERRQSDALAFLYRLSHVVSQYQTSKEIAEAAFPILQEEIACKRMWMGVLNEQGTHMVGQAGIGPGLRRNIINVQIELDLRHDALDDAIKSLQPTILESSQAAECSGLNRIMQRLKPGTIIIVPLVALGQVVGLLILEPLVSSPLFARRKLPLLVSVSSELGSVILARHFEAKIADAEKMRMASLFASGIAHNFNNMLQAIMGQASLIEIQVPESSPLSKSAKLITEAATKGAALISQLMSFSSNTVPDRKNIEATRLLKDSLGLYKSVVSGETVVELDLEENLFEVYADAGLLQRVITNILVNAKEALAGRSDGKIRIITRKVRLRSGEIDPELSPGSYLRIDVADNGPGMEPEKLERCFEPFFTTKHVDTGTGIGFSGSGLGLASAYSIIKQHEGIITVRSTLGYGAIFSIYLPLRRHERSIDEGLEGSIDNEQSSQIADVILLGIEGIVGTSLKSSLMEFGLEVSLEKDREGAIELVEKSSGKDAVLVLDADKEDARLIETIRSARSKNSSIKLIVHCLDGSKWSHALGQLAALQDLEVVEKTLGLWALQSTIRRMLGIRGQKVDRLTIEKEQSSGGDSQVGSDTGEQSAPSITSSTK